MSRNCENCIHAVNMSGKTEHKGNTIINYGTNALKCGLPRIENLIITDDEMYCEKYEYGTPKDNGNHFENLKIGVKKNE